MRPGRLPTRTRAEPTSRASWRRGSPAPRSYRSPWPSSTSRHPERTPATTRAGRVRGQPTTSAMCRVSKHLFETAITDLKLRKLRTASHRGGVRHAVARGVSLLQRPDGLRVHLVTSTVRDLYSSGRYR